jgi:HEPN domain-containing protein
MNFKNGYNNAMNSREKDIDFNKTIAYWTEGAAYDLDAAQGLFEKRKYPYALFFGHLALEKILKALVVKATKHHAPYTHSLPVLVSKVTFEIPEEIKVKLARYMEFFIEARYPQEQKEFYKKCTKKFVTDNLTEIGKIYQWLKEKL